MMSFFPVRRLLYSGVTAVIILPFLSHSIVYISDWESLFKYLNIKFFQTEGFRLIGLGFGYKVHGSSQ